jgi:hypothetical protein
MAELAVRVQEQPTKVMQVVRQTVLKTAQAAAVVHSPLVQMEQEVNLPTQETAVMVAQVLQLL